MLSIHFSSGGRYPVLRSLAILHLFIAAGLLAAGIGAAVWSLFMAPYNMAGRLILAFGALGGACLLCLSVLALAELMKLLIDIEHNSRMAAADLFNRHAEENARAEQSTRGRLTWLEGEETAEFALLRGH